MMKKVHYIFALLAVLCIPWMAGAQNLTVASGTQTNMYTPHYGYAATQHNQLVYPARMLTELSGHNITGMRWYLSQESTYMWNSTTTVKMAIVTDSTLDGLNTTADFTEVWNGTLNGKNDDSMAFDQPFPYNGGHLLVDIQTLIPSTGSVYYYGISRAGSAYSYNSVRAFLPKTTFAYNDQTFCPRATGLTVTSIDTNMATISWVGVSGTSYSVQLDDGEVVPINSGNNTYTFNDLDANVTYTAKVISTCSDGTVSNPLKLQFTTPCGYQYVLPWFTGFETDANYSTPACFTLIQGCPYNAYTYPYVSNSSYSYGYRGSGALLFYTRAGYVMNYSTYDYDHYTDSVNLIALPRMHDISTLNINFFARYYDYYGVPDAFQVGVMEGSTFVPVDSIHLTPNYASYTVDFSNYTGNGEYIAFRMVGDHHGSNITSTTRQVYLDNITVSNEPFCVPTNAPQVVSVGEDSVRINWVEMGHATSWEVLVSDTSVYDFSTVSTDDISPVDDTTALIENLTPNRYYYIYTRAVCSESSKSDWTDLPAMVHTQCGELTAPYSTTFDNAEDIYEALPFCWKRYDDMSYVSGSTTYPYIYTYGNGRSGNALSLYYRNATTHMMGVGMPAFADLNTLQLEFYAKSSSLEYITAFEVGVMEEDVFVPVDTITLISDYQTDPFTVSFANYTGSGNRPAFRLQSTYNYTSVYIDDVTVSPIPTCFPASGLAMTSATSTTATLDWTNPTEGDEPVSYDVIVSTTPIEDLSNVGAYTVRTATTKPYTVTGLSVFTNYYFYVRPRCSETNAASRWAETTGRTAACDDGCDINLTLITNPYYGWGGTYSNMTVSQGSYELFNSQEAVTAPSWQSHTDNFTIHVCPNQPVKLTRTTHYESQWSDYSPNASLILADAYNNEIFSLASMAGIADDSVFFTYTPDCAVITCPKPVDLTVEQTTDNGATLGWTEQGTATTWQIAYDTLGIEDAGLAAHRVLTTTNPATLANLTLGQTYTAWVRAVCAENDTSTWSDPTSFTPGLHVMHTNGIDTITACAGIIADDGGLFGSPATYQQSAMVIYPSTAGANVHLQGRMAMTTTSSYYYSELYVLDGDSLSGLIIGYYDATDSVIDISSLSGPLTLYFRNYYGTGDGFQLSVSCETPACYAVNDIRAVAGQHALNVSWADRGTGSSYLVEYAAEGFNFGDGTATRLAPTTGTTAAISGLAMGTYYWVGVASLCTNGDTMVNYMRFNTLCDTLVLPVSMGGETGGYPLCWDTVTGYSNYPSVSNGASYSHSGDHYIYFYNYAYSPNDVELVITPELGHLSQTAISFYARNYTTYGTDSLPFVVGVMEGNTFVPVDTIGLYPNQPYPDDPYIVFFTDYEGTGNRIALGVLGNGGAYVDDIRIFPASECLLPTRISSISPTPDSLILTWHQDGFANQWSVTYNARGEQPVTVTTNDTELRIGGLRGNTDYYFSLTTLCSATNHSVEATYVGRTSCNATDTLPYFTDFTDHMADEVPYCWTRDLASSQASSNGYIYFPAVYRDYSGNTMLRMFSRPADRQSIISLPTFDQPVDTLYVSFFAYGAKGSNTDDMIPMLEVGVMTDTGFFPVDTGAITNALPEDPFLVFFNSYRGLCLHHRGERRRDSPVLARAQARDCRHHRDEHHPVVAHAWPDRPAMGHRVRHPRLHPRHRHAPHHQQPHHRGDRPGEGLDLRLPRALHLRRGRQLGMDCHHPGQDPPLRRPRQLPVRHRLARDHQARRLPRI